MHKEFTITATGPAGSASAVLLVLCDTAPLPELVATYYHADDDDAPCKSGSLMEAWRMDRVTQRLEHDLSHPLSPKNAWWPHIPSEVFHGAAFVTWEGLWRVEEAGAWGLRVETYDAVVVYVDGNTAIMGNNCRGEVTELSRSLQLAAGYHPIKIVFYTNADPFELVLQVKRPSAQAFEPVPEGLFFHYPDAPLSASTTVTRFLPGQAIEPISFAFFGVAPLTQFAVSPDLPAGLRLSQQNVIEGTPTGTFDETTFTVTARSATATLSTTLRLTSRQVAPPEKVALLDAQGQPVTALKLDIFTPMEPVTVDYDDRAMISVSPALPEGLAFDAASDTIQGTAYRAVAATTFTVEARTEGGTKTATFSLEVPPCAFGQYFYLKSSGYQYDIILEKDGAVAFEAHNVRASEYGSVFCVKTDVYTLHLHCHAAYSLTYAALFREDRTKYFQTAVEKDAWFNTTLQMAPTASPSVSFAYATVDALVKQPIRLPYAVQGVYMPLYTEPALPEGATFMDAPFALKVTFQQEGLFTFSVHCKNDAGETVVALHFNVGTCPEDRVFFRAEKADWSLHDELSLFLESTGELVLRHGGEGEFTEAFLLCLRDEPYRLNVTSRHEEGALDGFTYLYDSDGDVVSTIVLAGKPYEQRLQVLHPAKEGDERRVWMSRRGVAKKWKQEGFRDSKWALRRELRLGTFSKQMTTVYLRYALELGSLTSALVPAVPLQIRANGGFVLYVNAQEALRVNLPAGEVKDLQAERAVDVSAWTRFDVRGELFHEGRNVVAVEYHCYRGDPAAESVEFGLRATLLPSRSEFVSYEGVATGSEHTNVTHTPSDAFFNTNDYACWEDAQFPVWLRLTFPRGERHFVNRLRVRAYGSFRSQPTHFAVFGVNAGVVLRDGQWAPGEERERLAEVNDPLFLEAAKQQVDVPLRAEVAYSALELVVYAATNNSDSVLINNLRFYADRHVFCGAEKKWPRTVADSVVYGKCPFLMIGEATRVCREVDDRPVWDSVDQSTCLTRWAGENEAFIDLGYRLYNCSMKNWERGVREALTEVIVREITIKEEDVHFYLPRGCSEESDLPSVCVSVRLRPHRLASQYVKMQLEIFNANATALFYKRPLQNVTAFLQIAQNGKIHIREQWSRKDLAVTVVIALLAVACVVLLTLYVKSASLGRESRRKKLSKRAIRLSRINDSEKQDLLATSEVYLCLLEKSCARTILRFCAGQSNTGVTNLAPI